MTTDHRSDHHNNNKITTDDLLTLMLKNQQNTNQLTAKGNGLDPKTMITIGIFLVQVFIGLITWTIQENMKRYEAYEPRIRTLESNYMEFKGVKDELNTLARELREFSSRPRFTLEDFNYKSKILEDSLADIKDSIKQNKGLYQKSTEDSQVLDRRIDTIERELKYLSNRIETTK